MCVFVCVCSCTCVAVCVKLESLAFHVMSEICDLHVFVEIFLYFTDPILTFSTFVCTRRLHVCVAECAPACVCVCVCNLLRN